MEWIIIENRLNGLLDSGRHSELRGALLMLNEVDIAQFMKQLEPEKLLTVFRVLPKSISADVFAYMETEQQKQLIDAIADSEIRALIDDMFLDDAVDFLEELPAGVVKRVLMAATPEKRNLINQFLNYPDNSAGAMMTIEFAEFHSGYTAVQALDTLKRTGLDKETIYTSYVIDEKRHLMGSVALRKLIIAPDDAPITSVMDSGIKFVRTLDDRQDVADTVRKYDLMTIPVVDNENRLVGIITADDVMDVIEQENTEDIEKMGALIPSEGEYLKTSVFRLALNRIPWLLILMISATFTGMVILHYEDLLNDTGAIGVWLMACIPMLMDTGGNSGSQASTLIIRGLALDQIHFRDLPRVLLKEIRVALIVGLPLAVVNFCRLYFFSRYSAEVSTVVSVSMYITVILAKSIGCMLPMLAKKAKLDPAIMASPIITTIVDVCSLLILFTIATATLGI